jgi:hypothetical protein
MSVQVLKSGLYPDGWLKKITAMGAFEQKLKTRNSEPQVLYGCSHMSVLLDVGKLANRLKSIREYRYKHYYLLVYPCTNVSPTGSPHTGTHGRTMSHRSLGRNMVKGDNLY